MGIKVLHCFKTQDTIFSHYYGACDEITIINKILDKTYLNTLTTADEWLKISQKFKERRNFPNGIGAVDGKHIILQQPKSPVLITEITRELTALFYLTWLALNMNHCLLMSE